MKEIERKWLVDEKKCPIFKYSLESFNLEIWETEQGYLNSQEDEWLIRARKVKIILKDDDSITRHLLDLKTKGMLSRDEITLSINHKEFTEIISKCGKRVYKTRYTWQTDEARYEIDVYRDHNFITCEVEFSNETEAKEFEAPDWCVKDVTEDPKYKNVNLVK